MNIVQRRNWLSDYVTAAFYLGMYLTHLFGVLYFRSRDIEKNMTYLEVEPAQANTFRRSLRLVTRCSVITFLLVTAFLFYAKISHVRVIGGSACDSVTHTQYITYFTYVTCWLSYPMVIYYVGVSLSISWIIFLLQETARTRLQQLQRRYCLWTNSGEDAIYDYLTTYSRKIRNSCSSLGTWFIAHNLILVLAIPFLIYFLLQDIKMIRGNKDKVEGTFFILVWIYIIIIWVTPLLFAERLQTHDDNFISAINKLCPGVIMETTQNNPIHLRTDTNVQTFTFESRSEVNKLLTYLKSRKSGFLVGSYSIQLKLSMFSLVLGLISFAPRIA